MPAQRLAAILLAFMLLFAAARFVMQLGGGGVIELTEDVSRLENTLNSIAYTHAKAVDESGEFAVYQVSFRTCPPCVQAHHKLLPKLAGAGLEPRMVTTARRGTSTVDERAAVVENIRRKDWAFTQAWWKENSPNGFYARTDLVPIEEDSLRRAELETLQDHVSVLAEILKKNGKNFGFPAFFWRGQDGRYRAATGYNPALTDIILADVRPQ